MIIKGRFNKAAFTLETKGFVVLNPASLPAGLTQAEYMDICCAMIRSCTKIVMLEGWQQSEGATAEYHLAMKLSKTLLPTSILKDNEAMTEAQTIEYIAQRFQNAARRGLVRGLVSSPDEMLQIFAYELTNIQSMFPPPEHVTYQLQVAEP